MPSRTRVLLASLFALTNHLLPQISNANEAKQFQVWERDGRSASIHLGTPKLQPSGLVTSIYRLVAIDSSASTPEMFVGTFGAVCQPQNDSPVQVLHYRTVVQKFVGGRWVQDSDKSFNPPQELEPNVDRDFVEVPSTVACGEAWRLVRSRQ